MKDNFTRKNLFRRLFITGVAGLALAAHPAQAQLAVSGSDPFPALAQPTRMVTGDFDKDGDVDVLYQNSITSGVGWNYMQNNGNGTYTTIAASGTGTFSAGPFNGITFTTFGAMFVIDYDNDGDFDLIDMQNNASRLLVQGASGFSVSGSNPFPTLPFAPRMVLIDADNDGDKDVLYQASSSSGVNWNYMQNNGNGTYTTIAASGTGTFSSGPFNGVTFTTFGAMYPIDYDRDGDFDLIDMQNSASRLLVRGASGFSVSGANPFPAIQFATRLALIDADGDGDADVLYQSGGSSGVGWNYMQNNGNGTYTTIAASGTGTFSSGPFDGVTFTNFGAMYVLDYEKDGDPDLIDMPANASQLLLETNTPPSLSSSTPTNGDGAFVRDANIVLHFSEAVVAGTGSITIRKTSDNSIVETIAANSASVTGTGTANVTVNPTASLPSNTQLYIQFDNTAFRDASGTAFGTLPPGSVTINSITSPSFLSFTTSAVLPVQVVNFTVLKQGDAVLVQWQTSLEQNLDHFDVEYSLDGVHFSSIHSTHASGAANGSSYSFVHSNPARGVQYYRLAVYEQSGAKSIQRVVAVRFDQSGKAIAIYPVPAAGAVNASFAAGQYRSVQLVDVSGHVLAQQAIGGNDMNISFDVQSRSSGLYFLRFAGNDGSSSIQPFTKK